MYAVVEPYVIHAQLQAEALKRGLNINIPGSGCSTSIVASACAYAGQGPLRLLTWAATPRTCSAWSGSRPRARSSAPARSARATAGSAARAPARAVRGICRGAIGSRGGMGVYTKCAIKLGPSLGDRATGRSAARCPPTACRVAETLRAYTLAVPDVGRLGGRVLRDLRQRDRLHLPPPVQPGRAPTSPPAFWLMYNDHAKTLERRAGDRRAAGDQGAHRGAAHLLPDHPRRPLAGRHRAPGQDPRRHPGRGRRLEGGALLRAGHGRVHQRLPAAPRPQAHQLRLGRRLHRQLDAVRHAGLGQGLRARRPPRASSATPPAASSCSAAATR